MPDNGTRSDYLSHRLLRILAARLADRGMQAREFRHEDEVIEIAATNPRDPEKGGRVVIGYEGYLVWECWAEFKTERDAVTAADVIHVLLTEDLTGRCAATGSQVPAAEAPAHAAVNTARYPGSRHGR
jgi:hypothetical protein